MRVVAMLVGSAALVGLASTQVSVGELTTALAGVDTHVLWLVAGTGLAVLFLRGLALWVVLAVLGHRPPPGRVVSVYAATVAVSTVVPGGQAGGAPINGYLVSQSSDVDYEDGITAVGAVATLNNAAILFFGLLGAGYLLATATGQDGGLTIAVIGIALIGLSALALIGVWSVRRQVEAVVASVLVTVGRVAVVIPRLSPPEREAIERRVSRLGDAVARLSDGTTRQFAMLAVMAALAHALTIVALWTSFAAVGVSVSIGVIMTVIPAGVATAVVPTPGGFGSIEIALVGLLATGTTASVPIASTAVLVYQSATTAPALVVGGSVLAVMVLVGVVDGWQLGSLWRDS
jgi:uncharacterized protein (TIRG00374 family)